jgi:uncharacterized protein (DUF488 family)
LIKVGLPQRTCKRIELHLYSKKMNNKMEAVQPLRISSRSVSSVAPQVSGQARSPPVYTIGHSTRSIDEFVGLLRTGDVTLVIDVRSIRRSRTNPQYNAETLPLSLADFGICYTPIAELGGRRSRQESVPPQVNGYWQNRSFHNYADYAMSAEFAIGMRRLLTLSKNTSCALMCAEAVWWKCHRRIIADYLLLHGRAVLHLMEKGRAEPASITPAATVQGKVLIYPAPASGEP